MSERSLAVGQALAVPKRGHGADEYEDAHAADPTTGRFAIADGASETSFAGRWAQLLVEQFVNASGSGPGWLAASRQVWAAEVDGHDLPWYAEAKREQGAYATFLGLLFTGSPAAQGRWQALAVGDSCLFQVRGDQLLVSFPMHQAVDFGNQPHLIGARKGRNGPHTEERGLWQSGDCFWLMTDAVAHWFLSRHEEGALPWRELLTLDDNSFGDWVEEQRESGALRNDDVTVLRIDV